MAYTDGLTEAANAEDKLFGSERLKAAIEHDGQSGPAETIDAIIGQVHAWTGGQKLAEDLTIGIICRT